MSHKNAHDQDANIPETDQSEEVVDTDSHAKKHHHEKGLGNEGSITHTETSSLDPTTSAAPTKKKSIFTQILSFWWVLVLLAVGIISLLTIVNTNPIAINPTDTPVTFAIDGVDYTIPADSQIDVKLSHGKHSVTLDGKDMGAFNFGWFDGESVINPTLSALVEVEILYTVGGGNSYEDKLSKNTITINGKNYTGPWRLIEPALYVKKTWDYGAYENSPDTISTKGDYEIKKELWLANDFAEQAYSDDEYEEEK